MPDMILEDPLEKIFAFHAKFFTCQVTEKQHIKKILQFFLKKMVPCVAWY